MNIKEKLLREKKKLIAYALTTGITITGLTGCAINNIPNDGEVNYDYLKDCGLLTLKYQDDSEVTYIVHSLKTGLKENYSDIKTEETVLCLSRKDINKNWEINDPFVENYEIESLANFLVKEENIKEYYEKEDITKIIEDYKQYRKDVGKVLIKQDK